MFKIELKIRDFRKSLYFYIVDAGKKTKKKRVASGCWHYIKSRANIKWTLEKIWAAGACQRPDISQQSILKQGFQKTHFPTVLEVETFFAVDLANF